MSSAHPKLLLNVKELADAYALKTLYDFLVEEAKFDGEIVFAGDGITSDRAKEVLTNVPIKPYINLNSPTSSIDAVVSCFSDIRSGGDYACPNLEVDISILKNCVKPLSKAAKDRLREKYKVSTKKPVVIIGYTYSSLELVDLLDTIRGKSLVILVGESPDRFKGDKSITVVQKFGVLKDYYAMADLALNCHNLVHTNSYLHNFVEATEGGPLFMVPSRNSRQYGYKQLVEARVIREFPYFDVLVNDTKDYIDYFELYKKNDKHDDKRSAHLMKSREKYLPTISSFVQFLLGRNKNPQTADLIIEQDSSKIRLVHLDSDWGRAKLLRVEKPILIESQISQEDFDAIRLR